MAIPNTRRKHAAKGPKANAIAKPYLIKFVKWNAPQKQIKFVKKSKATTDSVDVISAITHRGKLKKTLRERPITTATDRLRLENFKSGFFKSGLSVELTRFYSDAAMPFAVVLNLRKTPAGALVGAHDDPSLKSAPQFQHEAGPD